MACQEDAAVFVPGWSIRSIRIRITPADPCRRRTATTDYLGTLGGGDSEATRGHHGRLLWGYARGRYDLNFADEISVSWEECNAPHLVQKSTSDFFYYLA